MKTLSALFAIVVAVVVVDYTVVAEFCNHDSECVITDCGAKFHASCYKDHVCTCLPDNPYACTLQNECSAQHGPCTHNDHKWHCVDNVCRCRSYHGQDN